MSSPNFDTPDHDNLRTLSKVVLSIFLLVAMALLFWSIVRAETILTRNDNPRLLEQELRIRRGTILDKNNKAIAVNDGTPGRQQRTYPFSKIGPVVGFYSVIHGTSGAEDSFDGILRNDPVGWWQTFLQRSLHLPQVGKSIKLALDADLQLTADAALGQYQGALLLLELDNNDSNKIWVRTIASHPGYDPNVLDEQFENLGANENAPLLNRVTNGQYQPGLLLQPYILAFAVEDGLISMDDPVLEPDRLVQVNGEMLRCQSPPPDPASWSDVLQYQCPGPMLDLADQLGKGGVDVVFTSFGLDRNPVLEIDTATIPDEALEDPLLAGIGQDNLSVTPLQIGLAASAFLNGGTIPQPQIAMAIQDKESNWQPWTLEPEVLSATTAEAAVIILQTLSQVNGIHEYSPLVLSGPEGSTNAWYVGLMEHGEINYVAVVVLEGSKSRTDAVDVGRAILSAVRENKQPDEG